MKKIGELIKISISDFVENDIFTKAAAISYYTIFSLPPMLLVILYTSAIFHSRVEVEAAIFEHIGQLSGKASARELIKAIDNLGVFEGSLLTQIISISVLIFTSTTIFTVMQASLNSVFKVKPKTHGWGIVDLIKDRLLSFSLVLGLAFILIVSLAMSAAIAIFGEYLSSWIPAISGFILTVISTGLSFLITTILFGLIFKFLPDAKLKWRDTITAAIITSLLFAVGKSAIDYYISNGDTATLYETAGAVMVMMLWVYYASVIFLFGAVLTASYVKIYGSGKIQASDIAVKYEEKKIISPLEENLAKG